MLWARRGESWKQKHFTTYPSSLRVAAADAPARPLPTTSTVCFRLLAGFTSFISKRCLSHLRSMGPDGTREFSDTRASNPRRRASFDSSEISRDDDRGEPQPDEPGQQQGQTPVERTRR